MWGIGPFALLLSLAQAAAPPPGDMIKRRLLDQAERGCPELPDVDGYRDSSGMTLINHARELAGLQSAGRHCRLRPAFAIRVARELAPLGRWPSVAAQSLFADLYERGIGVRRDSALALEHRRLFWLLSPYDSPPLPFASEAERDLYLVRPETIVLLRRYAAAEPDQLRVQQFARFRLAQALYAQSPENRAEAVALLAGEVPFPGGYMLRARIALEGGDDSERVATVTGLSRLAMVGDAAEEARSLLRVHARRLLAANPTPAQREEAIRMLAAIAWDLNWRSVADLMAAVRDANGGRAPATASDEAAHALRRRLAPSMGEDDYPASGMRANEQGAVRLRALIGPSGRILFTEPLIDGPEQPWSLVVAVRQIYVNRPLRPVDLGPNQPTPYMWIALPVIRFRMTE
jgi:hypothetical protein